MYTGEQVPDVEVEAAGAGLTAIVGRQSEVDAPDIVTFRDIELMHVALNGEDPTT